MLVQTQGIVTKIIPYQESSSIVNVYTEAFGMKSYLIRGGRKKNATVRSSLFQPLQILNLVVYNNEKNTLQQIKEVSVAFDNNNIAMDIVRTTLAFFITEVLNLSIKEENQDIALYEFIRQTILSLNNVESSRLKDFHLYFLFDFAKYLGFEPMEISLETSSKQERNDVLSKLIYFYQEHITNQRPIQSHQILSTIL
ncbi:MAG: DNA repair protein RecO [Bacteroidales bacterium]|nr:DNA repair protein RecO [Candidatus Scybalousia scybalohippi]